MLLLVFLVQILGVGSQSCHLPTLGKQSACKNFTSGEGQHSMRGNSLLQTASVRLHKGEPKMLEEHELENEALYSMEATVSLMTGNVFRCKTPINASQMSPDQLCPPACPYWAEETPGSPQCSFRCLPASECGSLVGNATIADRISMQCRACAVPNCGKCVRRNLETSEEVHGSDTIPSFSDLIDYLEEQWGAENAPMPEEQCVECKSGYTLHDGRCLVARSWVWNIIFIGSASVVLFFTAWYVHLVFRPIVNEDGLEFGLRCRSRTRLHMGADHFQRREYFQQLWPLTSDLRETEVAGPALTLFFRFHAWVVGWALMVAGGWMLTATLVNKDLLVLGTLPASTPQQMCSVTSWGHHVQESTMLAKVIFTFVVYIGTFLASVIHAVSQLRRYQVMDDETTMEDFAAVCRGISSVCNSDSAEEELTKALRQGTGEPVVGVSICWDFAEVEDYVNTIAHRDMTKRSEILSTKSGKHFKSSHTVKHDDTDPGVLTRFFSKVDVALGFVDAEATSPTSSAEKESWPGRPPPRSRSPPRSSSAVKNDERTMLRNLKCSDYAFVVFETETSRDAAVARANEFGGIPHTGSTSLRLSKMTCEPDTVEWTNFTSDIRAHSKLYRLALGVLLITCALFAWATFAYMPYAYYVCSFSYARGESPGVFASTFFMLLVVTGNQIMYFLCSYVADKVRYQFSEKKEVIYLILYTFSCIVNVVLDLVVTYRTTYSAMVAIQARTHSGQSLTELSTVELFMSYPIQKALGHQLFWYAFPCCFLIPFVLEPFFTIWLPRHISELIVRSNPSCKGHAAEEALKYWVPMDLSRYADIILNMSIAVMVLFFPGGYTWKMFGVMWISQAYCYCVDHYRVLRAVPGFHISGMTVDNAVNALLVIPCCIILSALIFKLHCLQGFGSVSGYDLFWRTASALLLHCIIHWLVLVYLVPYFGRPHSRSHLSFAEAASRIPCSWFNANLVHCLRSKYIHRHHPAMTPFIRGKEHMLVAHPAIGAHFHGTAVQVFDTQ